MDRYYKYKGTFIHRKTLHIQVIIAAPIYLVSISGISLLTGFSIALAVARKRDPRTFDKATITSVELPETGTSLAFRALRWGTLYAFTGCSLLFYGIWKLSGATDVSAICCINLAISGG